MCPEDGVLVDVVCVGTTPAGVIGGKPEGIEILCYGNNRRNIVVVGVYGRGELRFNNFAGQGDRMRRLEM